MVASVAVRTAPRVPPTLAFRTPFAFLRRFRADPLAFFFECQARFGDAGSEHELCWVFAGFVEEAKVRANDEEVKDWTFLEPDDLDGEIGDESRYTPWFRIAWHELRTRHWKAIERIVEGSRQNR